MTRFRRCSPVLLALLGILVAGAGLRLYQLDARSLWFDEAFSWRLIQFPFPEMIRRIGQDNHPPLYFLLLKCWVALFGESLLALRSFSVLAGSLAIVGTFLFTTEACCRPWSRAASRADGAGGHRVALTAAALVALSPFQIRYSQEVRMYALAGALTVLSSWVLFRSLRRPSRLRCWLVYAGLTLLLAYTHYYALFTLATQAVFVALVLLSASGWSLRQVLRTSVFWHAVLAALLVLLGFLPWLPVFLHQHAQVQKHFWSAPLTSWDVAELCYQMFVLPEYFPSPPRQRQLLALDLCVLGLALLGRKARAPEWYVLGSAVSALVFSLALAAPVTLRYFVMSHLFLLVGLAVLLGRLPFRRERNLVIAVVLALFAGLYIDFWRALDIPHKPGALGAAAFLQRQRRDGQPVIVCVPFFFFSLLYHAPDRSGYYLYTDGRPIPHYYGTAALTGQDFLFGEHLQTLRSRRVWIVATAAGVPGVHFVPTPPAWVEKSRHTFPDVAQLGELIVIEYDTAGGEEPS